MRNEVLFTIAQDPTYNTTNIVSKLEGLQRKGFEQYYDAGLLSDYIAKTKQACGESNLSFGWYPYNVPGQWVSDNIAVPNKVVPEPITLERVKEELDGGRFDYIVVATYLSGYSTFRNIARYVHERKPEVKVIAASVGALLPESAELADFTLKGNQVSKLRAIVGQPVDDPLRVVSVRSDTETRFNGMVKRSSYALLISSLGCMYGCDFCPSTAQFGTQYSAPFSAEQIREAVIRSHEQISPGSSEFTISLAEPQGLGNVKLWKRVFAICRDLPFVCNLVSTTSSKVIERYTLEEMTVGNLRLGTVNIGVESLLKGYKKNEGEELRRVNDWLQEAGINVVSTFIVGLDWQDPDNIWEEVKLLKALESSGYIVSNLEMQPGTPLYNRYKEEGRLLNVPPELLAFYGYQAYLHPHFQPGFNDMLPLLDAIGSELASGKAAFSKTLGVFLHRNSKHEQEARDKIRQEIASFKQKLDPSAYSDGDVSVLSAYTADLYYRYGFKQMDLFHPFLLSTN